METIKSQKEFESYFVRAVALNRTDLVEEILNFNLKQGRNTVVSVLQLNAHQPQNLPFIDNVTHLSLRKAGVPAPVKMRIADKIKDVADWNPVLLMVALNQLRAVELLLTTRASEHLHLASCMTKQFSSQRQTTLVYNMRKAIRAESYALKLCVRNQNQNMLRLLLTGRPPELESRAHESVSRPRETTESRAASTPMDQLAQIWNLGHAVQCLRDIVKFRWEDGLAGFLANQRVRQLFGSANDVDSFLELLFQMLDIVTGVGNPDDRHRLLAMLMPRLREPPYAFLRLCLAMFVQGKFRGELDRTVAVDLDSNRVSLPFLEAEVEQIRRLFDRDGVFDETFEQIEQKFAAMEKSDAELRRDHEQLLLDARQLQIDSSAEATATERLLDRIEDLGSFAYKVRLGGDGRETEADTLQDNVCLLVLAAGNEQAIDYFYSRASDCNVKSMLLGRNDRDDNESYARETNAFNVPNRFELTQTVPQLEVRFFRGLIARRDPAKFQFVFQFLIDQMKLRHVLEVLRLIALDDGGDEGPRKSLRLIAYVLANKKFASLFEGALEMQKFNFVEQLLALLKGPQALFNASLLEAADLKKLQALPSKCAGVAAYAARLAKGDDGSEFLKATQEYFLLEASRKQTAQVFVGRYAIREGQPALYPESDGVDPSQNVFRGSIGDRKRGTI